MASPSAITAFFEESDTHLDTAETSLLALEKKKSDKDLINELFRAIHSMKGNAGIVGFTDIHNIAMEMEELLEEIRDRKKTVAQAELDKLFSLLNKIKALVKDAKGGGESEKSGSSKEEETGEAGIKEEMAHAQATASQQSPTESGEKPGGKGAEGDLTGKDAKKVHSYLTFSLGKERYGFEINFVREILQKRHITRVPNAKSFLSGVMNLRGKVVPVINARKRLDFASDAEENKNGENIIIVEEDGLITGVLVDRVEDIVKFEAEKIVSAEKDLAGRDDEFIVGIGRVGNTSVMLLDVKTFCNSKENFF